MGDFLAGWYTTTMQKGQQAMAIGLAVLVILGAAQIVAQYVGLYWIYPDFDIPMHALGGVWLGFVATWAVQRFDLAIVQNAWQYLLFVGGFVLIIGLLWEGFEFGMDQWLDTGMQPSMVDTILDLFMDLLGGYMVALSMLLQDKVFIGYGSE